MGFRNQGADSPRRRRTRGLGRDALTRGCESRTHRSLEPTSHPAASPGPADVRAFQGGSGRGRGPGKCGKSGSTPRPCSRAGAKNDSSLGAPSARHLSPRPRASPFPRAWSRPPRPHCDLAVNSQEPFGNDTRCVPWGLHFPPRPLNSNWGVNPPFDATSFRNLPCSDKC